MARRRGNNSEDVSVQVHRNINGNGPSNHDRNLKGSGLKELKVAAKGTDGLSSATSATGTTGSVTMPVAVGPVVASIFDYTLMVSLVFGGCCTYVVFPLLFGGGGDLKGVDTDVWVIYAGTCGLMNDC